MKISGFTFCKNATKLFYPVKESILSILPIVNEFVVALSPGDQDDRTEAEILSIGSEKIKIVHTEWDLKNYPNGAEYARQTDIAKAHCTGDWLFYLQSDEVVHEKYLDEITSACKTYLKDERVEGFLFNYRHFWGDFDHYIVSHVWYAKEIRIIRNDPDIHSWRDAQSFRRIPDFHGNDYFREKNTSKLQVIALSAFIYHYGYVRPPHIMQDKRKNHHANYEGTEAANTMFQTQSIAFDYGDLDKLEKFASTHPAVLESFIPRFDWKDMLHYGSVPDGYLPHKHEKWKYKLITWIEQQLLDGKTIMDFKNYKRIN